MPSVVVAFSLPAAVWVSRKNWTSISLLLQK